MSITAMKQALEALEYFSDTSNSAMDKAMSEDAITSLRQTIEQAEKQEPVAWRRYEDGMWVYYETKAWDDLQPLYTHPQPKREPLTLEQLREHWQVAKVLDMTDAEIDFADYVLIARDIEALYGIKG